MTATEAKRYVCRILAWTLRADFDNGAEWLEQGANKEPLSEADQTRVRAAAERMVVELDRRGRSS